MTTSDEELVKRLRQYEGAAFETTACYNGVRDEAADAITRLTREKAEARAQGAEGWKPIETAPMVGGQFVPVMLWIDGFNTPDIGGWLDGVWVTPDDYFDITGKPTHWRPLPPPPASPEPRQ